MALPRTLKFFNLFNDSNNWMGIVNTITLPKLTRKLEDYQGGGMNGAVGVDLGLDPGALTLEWSIGGQENLLFKQMGIPNANGIKLRFMGSIQRDDTGEVNSVEIVMSGRHQELDRGEMKLGENTSTKIKTRLTYYKEVVDGKTLVEIDLLNMVEKYDGVDRLEQHRKNIGL